jgi:predicted lactoylglutathione lyase
VEQRVSLITLGVSNVGRARRFYEALGWRGQEVEDTVFFQVGGLVIVIWARSALADDANVADDGPSGFRGIALAQNVRSRDEVDMTLELAEQAGATITRAAADTFYGGYAGYFADPDGHLWEVAHNPGFTLRDDGTLELPDFGAAPARDGDA